MSEKTLLVKNRVSASASDELDFDFKTNATQEETKAEGLPLKQIAYQDLKENINIFCDLCFRIFFVCYGILQFFAISSGLLKVFHANNIFTLLISALLAFLPVIGSILGLWGACTSWGWNLWTSIFVFALPYFLIHTPMLMIIAVETYKDLKRWRIEGKI